MTNDEFEPPIEEQLQAIATAKSISLAKLPRLKAYQVLDDGKKLLYALRNIEGHEWEAVGVSGVWALALTIHEPFITGLPTYQRLLNEGPAWFWAACWWFVAAIKFSALVTGNVYLRRTAWAFGALVWFITAGTLIHDYGHYTTYIGFAVVFSFSAYISYVRAGFDAQDREILVSNDATAQGGEDASG